MDTKYKNTFGESSALRTLVSYMPNHATATATPIELGAFLEAATIDETEREKVERIRAAATLDEKKRAKTAAPCIIPAALYEGTHKATDTHTLTGFLCVDIDRKDNQSIPETEWENLPTDLINSQIGKYIAFIGESASGWKIGGYFVIVCIKPHGSFEYKFNSLRRWFELQGVAIDRAAKNINHCRALSYQTRPPQLTLEPEPYPFELSFQKVVQASTAALFTGGGAEYMRACKAVELIEAKKLDIVHDFADWAECAFSLATFGEGGRALFHKLSAVDSERYDRTLCDLKFSDILKNTNNSVGLGSFWRLVYGAGIKPEQIKINLKTENQ